MIIIVLLFILPSFIGNTDCPDLLIGYLKASNKLVATLAWYRSQSY